MTKEPAHDGGTSVVRASLTFLSSAFLTCSLPPFDLGWLAWIFLVPLMVACHGLVWRWAALLGFVCGIAANVGIYHWVFEVKGFGIHHFLILATYFSLFPAVWCGGMSMFNTERTLPYFAASALWVLCEYARSHAGFMAFPWGTLAQTQHHNLAILQIATVTGEYGVAFLVVLANTALADVLLHGTWRRAVTIGFLIAAVHLVGTLAKGVEPLGTTIRVAVVQPNILRDERSTRAGRADVFNRLERLTLEAAGSHPAFIVWPETAIAGNLRSDLVLAADVMGVVQETDTPVVLGAGEVEKFATRDVHGKIFRRAYNAAYVAKPVEGFGAPYVKRVLMPFGEYVPLESLVGWPAWLAPPIFRTEAGHTPSVFTLSDGTPLAPLICWENLFAALGRESVQAGARLLVVLTNDGWFGDTAEPYQHNTASVLRAVENRVPVVAASNTGPSQIIDAYGRVVAQASRAFSQEIVVGDVKVGSSGSVYTRIGDVFTFAVIGGLVLVALRRRATESCSSTS